MRPPGHPSGTYQMVIANGLCRMRKVELAPEQNLNRSRCGRNEYEGESMRRHITMGLAITALTLVGSGSVSAQIWGRADTPRSGVCFYEDANFEGQYFCSSAGQSTAQVPPGTNDRISSVRIFGDAEVTV